MKLAMEKVKDITKEVHYNSFELHKQDMHQISVLKKKIEEIAKTQTLKEEGKLEEEDLDSEMPRTFYNKK